MRYMGFTPALVAGFVVAAAFAVAPAQAEVQKAQFKVVGTWNNLSPFQKFEKPYWEEVMPKASGGKITGKISSIVELGLKGWEVMRLTKLGVFDAAFAAYGYVASEEPALEGIDLSSVSSTFEEGHKVVNAYAPVAAKAINRAFNSHYMMTYPFPSQMIWCNADIKHLSDLKGKRVRVYATTLGDFVEGAGGTSVTISFAEVVPALQKGVADCGITGTMPAYQAKWHEVITHAMLIRVGMGLAFFAISNKKWNTLNKDTQALLSSEAKKMEDFAWQYSHGEDEEALACLSGNGKCTKGEPGHVVLVKPGPEDYKERERILKEYVLKKWAQRCSDECVADWNRTVAPIIGVKAEK